MTLDIIQKYLENFLKEETKKIVDNNKIVKENHAETKKLTEEIQLLRTTALIFHNTTCSKCGLALDLPAIHFMCKHSYHERCAIEGECSICFEKNQKVLTKRDKSSINELLNDTQKFYDKIKGKDGIENVIEYFGYNLFDNLKYIEYDDENEDDI